MKKRIRTTAWSRGLQRSLNAMTRMATASGTRMLTKAPRSVSGQRTAATLAATTSATTAGAWLPGVVMGALGVRRFRLYRPPGIESGECLPLMVMLHGCGQDADSFAASTRMNSIARRERFLVLYPEQDRLANAQGCWNWFDTDTGRAYGEAALIVKAVDQVCLLHPVDKSRVAIAGLSAGASMAALLVARHPGRFKAVVMHSGVPPGTAHSSLSAWGAMHGHRATMPMLSTPTTMAAHWPPLMVIHGDADAVVSPRNGRVAARVWARAAGGRAVAARNVQRGKRYRMCVTDFKREGSTVATLVAVDRLAHAWSGGAACKPFGDAQGPDASRMAWAFAARQFRVVA